LYKEIKVDSKKETHLYQRGGSKKRKESLHRGSLACREKGRKMRKPLFMGWGGDRLRRKGVVGVRGKK